MEVDLNECVLGTQTGLKAVGNEKQSIRGLEDGGVKVGGRCVRDEVGVEFGRLGERVVVGDGLKWRGWTLG